jgi:transposase-like protein
MRYRDNLAGLGSLALDRVRGGAGRISMGGTRRANHQSRVEWWRGQFQRQEKTNLSVTELCRQLGVSVATFYYWRKRVHEATSNDLRQSADVRPSRRMTTSADTTSANFVPVSILEPAAGTELEIELTNACVLRLKGAIDLPLLQAAITATGQLDGSRQGAN